MTGAGYFAGDPRPLRADDAQAARWLLFATLGITPYIDHAIEVVELAERGNVPEYRSRVIERDGTVAALAIFGSISGTQEAARVHALAVSPAVTEGDVGARLIESVVAAAREEGAAFLLAEMPEDPATGGVLALLKANGFTEAARVPDFFREGVPLVFLKREL